MRIGVQVTKQDIAAGIRQSCRQCPVALAIHRATGLPASVSIKYYRLYTSQGMWRDVLPNEAGKFVYAFDDYLDCRPFEFHLNIPKRIMEAVASR